jgi:arginyl-tRNA synthetase
MKENIKQLLQQTIANLQQQHQIPAEIQATIQLERTRDKKFGDFACNIALLLAKETGSKPRELAEKIVAALPKSSQVQKVEIAGPGFINFFLNEQTLLNIVPSVLNLGKDYGRSNLGAGKKIHLEFVSCNPNGPLHVGHGRGAAYGACVANLLEAIGYQVHREYYVNDAGRQMDILALSVWLHYLELFGATIKFPNAGYKGDYVIDIAKTLKIKYGVQLQRPAEALYANLPPNIADNGGGDKEIYIDALVAKAKELLGPENYRLLFEFGLQNMLTDIRQDLEEFGVTFQQWFHESSLFQNSDVARCIEKLKQANLLYEKEGAIWFRTTQFGDEKDRVIIRENGLATYFTSDMAYHFNKFERGFDQSIDIFGSDHHGYAPRMKAFLRALNLPIDKFLVLLVQFAILYRGKEKVQMSTRSGSFVTLRELRKEVGNDAVRFFYIMRKPEQHLDFDLELAKSQSNENPVYYIQYAHARICSVWRQLDAKKLTWDQSQGLANLNLLTSTYEQDLMRGLEQYPEIIEAAATQYEPHLVAHYLQELAHRFHTYYNAEQFLVEDAKLRDARLVLAQATKQVLINGLQLLGVSTPETM